MDKIRSESNVHRVESEKKPGIRRQKIASLLQDLVAAAAAAMIIFWFSGPVLTMTAVPPNYSEKVNEVSNSVGVVFEAYLNFYDRANDKFYKSVYEIEF